MERAGSVGTVRWTAEATRLIDYVVIGNPYAEILNHYVDITGHAPGIPRMGLWVLAVQA